MRNCVVTCLMLGIVAVGCQNSKTTTTNREATVYQVKHKEKTANNYHLNETQKAVENNRDNKARNVKRSERYKRKVNKYLNRLNEYNRYKEQNEKVGAFDFY